MGAVYNRFHWRAGEDVGSRIDAQEQHILLTLQPVLLRLCFVQPSYDHGCPGTDSDALAREAERVQTNI